MVDDSGYQAPPPKAEDVIRSAFSNPELMRQLVASYEEELRGEMGTPPKRDPRQAPRSRERPASAKRSCGRLHATIAS
jgi:hypothetical protein